MKHLSTYRWLAEETKKGRKKHARITGERIQFCRKGRGTGDEEFDSI